MILKEIKLKDFRCFFGEASIKISTDPKKNVTIIYADNGVGKTTILNALLWCFFETTTKRFEKQRDILNYDAVNLGRSTASVEVLFQHQGNEYTAKRNSQLTDSSDRLFYVVRHYDDGTQKTIDAPETFINTVIPRDMAPHFLFDGEHAEFLPGEDNRGNIRDAVRNILGCSLIERAIEDLTAASRYYRNCIPSKKGAEKVGELNDQCDEINKKIENLKKSVRCLIEKKKNTENQIKDIDEKLRNTRDAKDLQLNRDQFKKDLDAAKKLHAEYEKEAYKWLGENGRYVVSELITQNTLAVIEDREYRGQIPSPYNEEFVDEILRSNKCICGRPITESSPEYKKVENLKLSAANHAMRNRMIRVRSFLNKLTQGRNDATKKLLEAKSHVSKQNVLIEKYEMKIGEIRDKLKGIDSSDISEREGKRDSLSVDLETIEKDIFDNQVEIKSLEREISSINEQIKKFTKINTETEIIGYRMELCNKIIQIFEQELNVEESKAYEFLKSEIESILASTTRKQLRIAMTEDYQISLVSEENMPLPKSSGENQLLGLAFTCALTNFAKKREKLGGYRLLSGTIAPLILDSPFGQLDNIYRELTAAFVPKMARQVILLVSDSQSTNNLIDVMESHIGAEYLLVWHDKKSQDDNKSNHRLIKGRDYKVAVHDATFNGTVIQPIMN